MANMIKGVDVANAAQSVVIPKISFWREHAAEWIVIFQGIADGKTIQRVRSNGLSFATEWCDIQEESQLDLRLPASCYRIKPEPKKQWCRMYLVKGVIGNSGECFYSAIAKNGHINLDDVEKSPIFVRWLTGRIEYELPEGEV